MEIEGKIILDIPEVGGTSKAGNVWKKKEWVLETFGQYPRKVKFDFFGDRVDQNRLEVGKSYKISFDIESRDFNNRWYTDIRAFASQEIVPPSYGQPAAPATPAANPAPAAAAPFASAQNAAPADPFASNDSDDLPF